jgi:hypothetical protein
VNDCEPVERELEGVGDVVLERVVRLRVQVNADDVEPGPVVADGAATSPREEIQ